MNRHQSTKWTSLFSGLTFCVVAVVFQIWVIGNLETGEGGINLPNPWEGVWLVVNIFPYWISIIINQNAHMPNYTAFLFTLIIQWFLIGFLLSKLYFKIRGTICLSQR